MSGPRFRPTFHLALRRQDRLAEEVDDEIQFHLDARAEQLVRFGMAPEAARAEAMRRFGSIDEARRRLHESAMRREGRMHMREQLEGLRHDLRYAARGLRKRPGFTAAVILTLALGIGANATMFGIVDRLLLRPPAYLQDPARAHRVYIYRTFDGVERPYVNIQYKRYLDLTQNTHSFSHTAAFFNANLAIGTGEESREREVALVSASFWPLFGVRPALGRFFGPEEDKLPAGSPVAVLGYGEWQSKYGGGRDVLGAKINIGSQVYTIIGVAPKGFTGISMNSVVAFIPITAGANDQFAGADGRRRDMWYATYNMSWMVMLARRKPGVSVEAATADISNAARRSYQAQLNPRQFEDQRPHAVVASILTERGPKQGQQSKVAIWLIGVSATVLLIACANVANLLLAHALRRRREIAVRLAIGVGRGRLLRQLLTESVLLALGGAVAGLLLAQWGGSVLRAVLLPDVAWSSMLMDGRILLFAGAAALAVGLLTGLVPAVHASRPDIAKALKAGVREGTLQHSGLRRALLVVQAALSVVLLVGAGLFVRSLHNVRALDLGFDGDKLLFVSTELRGMKLDHPQEAALKDRLLERAQALPGVEAASRGVTVPFYMTWNNDLYVAGIDSVNKLGEFDLQAVSPTFFRTMGTRIIRGRGIAAEDRQGSQQVMVVSQSMAKTLWPTKDALGQCVKVGADTMPCTTVVGVAQDIKNGDLIGTTPGLQYYLSVYQLGAEKGGLFVRTRGEGRTARETLRRELQKLMPGTSYVNVKPLSEILDPNIRPWRLGATMFSIFGALALIVAAIGLYSVIAYNVTQRTHEMGVRIALGARNADVVRMVVGEGVRVAILGLVIGTGAALVAGKYVKPLLYDVSTRDPLTFGVVLTALLAIAAAASFLPARRASRVDPSVALRTE